MTKIEINNLTTNFFDEAIIKKLILHILNLENCKNCSLSIVIVGPRKIKKLNKKYRNKNKTTDVLSFAVKNGKIDKFIDPTNNLGEVIVCPKYIKKITKREGAKLDEIVFIRKFLQTLIHGVLHLLGYNHKTIEKAQEMKEKEDLFQKFIERLKVDA